MEKNGDDLELQTLLNGKEQKSHNEEWKQKNSSAVNGKFLTKFYCISILFSSLRPTIVNNDLYLTNFSIPSSLENHGH